MAAEDREKITDITLTVDSSIEAGSDGSDVDVTSDSGVYTVTDVDVVNDDGEWVSGSVPKIEVTLEADDDYYFASMSSSKVKLKGDDAKYVSSRRKDDNSTLIVTIKLDELEGSMEIEDVRWEDENSPIARWEEADGAKNYQIRLYRGSGSVGETVTTSGTSYNFSGKITREGDYYFKIRAVDSSSNKGEWFESDSLDVDDDLLDDIKSGFYGGGNGGTTSAPAVNNQTAGWIQNNVGWWYRNADGSYPANGWKEIGGAWYCFNDSGYMRTGWIQSGNTWYYCDLNSGHMFANCWANINEAWYFFDASGRMLTNTYTPDGFYVNESGVWVR